MNFPLCTCLLGVRLACVPLESFRWAILGRHVMPELVGDEVLQDSLPWQSRRFGCVLRFACCQGGICNPPLRLAYPYVFVLRAHVTGRIHNKGRGRCIGYLRVDETARKRVGR